MHVDDWLAVVRTVLSPPTEGPTLSGVVHATGPEPVRNADLMTALRRSLGRPAAPPTPARLVRLGAVLLRTDPPWRSPVDARCPPNCSTRGSVSAAPTSKGRSPTCGHARRDTVEEAPSSRAVACGGVLSARTMEG